MQNIRNLRVQGLRPSASEAAKEQLGDGDHSAQRQQPQPQNPKSHNAPSHIQDLIFQTLNQQTGTLRGWQCEVHTQERIRLIFNL